MIDLGKRLAIRKEQMEAGEVLMTKIRADVKNGWIPRTSKELGELLKIVGDYQKKVGFYEETKDIMEKMGLEGPKMEKLGVECQGNHLPEGGNMVKQASGDLRCKFCGQSFTEVKVADTATMKEQLKQAPGQAKGAIDKIFGV